MYIRVAAYLVRHLCAVASQGVQLQLEEGSILSQLVCPVLYSSLMSYCAIALYYLPLSCRSEAVCRCCDVYIQMGRVDKALANMLVSQAVAKLWLGTTVRPA